MVLIIKSKPRLTVINRTSYFGLSVINNIKIIIIRYYLFITTQNNKDIEYFII